ncbi:hypothetical protein [Neolewinella agarilytica]|nr:hypothetical protein [Neolewinella agarilytica]
MTRIFDYPGKIFDQKDSQWGVLRNGVISHDISNVVFNIPVELSVK